MRVNNTNTVQEVMMQHDPEGYLDACQVCFLPNLFPSKTVREHL